MVRYVLSILLAIVVVAAFGYGVWHLKRWWNYTMGYEEQVQATVCQMVKPEMLKDPSKCK